MTTSTVGLLVTGEEVHRFGKDLENLRKDCSQFCWELDLGLDGKESQRLLGHQV